MNKERDFGPDLLRVVASLFVISAHFFLNTEFYYLPVTDFALALCAWLRMIFMTSVPLFIMLSGWFCINRGWKRGYLRGLLPVLLVYAVSAALSLLLRRVYLGEPFTLLGAIRRIADYSANPYAWYVEMYIGLYLLMPLLNAGWKALDSRGRTATLLSLAALCALYTVTNIFFKLLPEWWAGIYPIEYYLLGAWLREHRPRCRGVWLLLGWFAGAAACVALRISTARGQTFGWMDYTQTYGLPTAFGAACLFSLAVRWKGTRIPKSLRRAVEWAARLSLPMFLLSYIFEQLFYPRLNAAGLTMAQKLPYLPLMALLIALCSAMLGQLVDWVVKALMRLVPEPKPSEAKGEGNHGS